MHMADALLSPAVGLTMGGATAATVAYCSWRLRDDPDDRRVPLMGVLGAFLFTAQMINFSIPGTGSSGHLGGGLLLAILVGPHAAFLVMASVLIVQALFFADGGLLALGCNIFNLGFFPAFVGYPIYRHLAGASSGTGRAAFAAIVSAVISLQLGALGVVVETVASGVSALPLETFAAFMLPIHLAIGIVEGLVTAAVVGFVSAARPGSVAAATPARGSSRAVVATFLGLAVALGGVGAWYASERPDGLEWSIAGASSVGTPGVRQSELQSSLAQLQADAAVLPHYGIRSAEDTGTAGPPGDATAGMPRSRDRLGTTLAGLVGGAIALALVLVVGLVSRRNGKAP